MKGREREHCNERERERERKREKKKEKERDREKNRQRDTDRYDLVGGSWRYRQLKQSLSFQRGYFAFGKLLQWCESDGQERDNISECVSGKK